MGILKSLILAVVLAQTAQATPYFRFVDPAHPQISAGAFVDPFNGRTDYGSMLALITHSTRDGSILPSIHSDWVLLGLGGGYGHGTGFMAAGPSANLAPFTKGIALRLLNAVTAEDRYLSLKSLLAPKTGNGPDITGSFGPQLFSNVIEEGHFVPVDKWRGQFRIFAGAAWHF